MFTSNHAGIKNAFAILVEPNMLIRNGDFCIGIADTMIWCRAIANAASIIANTIDVIFGIDAGLVTDQGLG